MVLLLFGKYPALLTLIKVVSVYLKEKNMLMLVRLVRPSLILLLDFYVTLPHYCPALERKKKVTFQTNIFFSDIQM